MIGLDTSHSEAFVKRLNDPAHPEHVPGAKIIAAVKTFSPDMALSASRVERFTEVVRQNGVEIVGSIRELCQGVDAVMIESLDGRAHLPQARAVIAEIGGSKPLFIDKPLSASLREAREIYRVAHEAGTPVFTASAYRFYPSLEAVKSASIGDLRAAISYGPAHFGEHHPDLFFYGVHTAEALYAVLGRGCESVTRTFTKDTDVSVGVWSGGRIGVLHALRTGPLNTSTTGVIPHQVTVFGTGGSAAQDRDDGTLTYTALLEEIVRFFQTRVAPVDPEETSELFAFLEAAQLSHERGGVPVRLDELG
jgi:predicted dehydrogenase